jgi:RWD domain.
LLNISEHSAECVSFLYSYGFYRSHCQEALELTHGDVGVALEVLLSQYFKLGLTFPFIINNNSITNGNNSDSATNHWSSEILQQREEEKCVLESIYDSAFEERIANRLWVLNLHLEYLLDFYSNSGGRENEWNNEGDLEDRDSNCDRDLNMTAKSQPQFCR